MAGAKRGGEDEARRKGADGVAAGAACGDIAAHDAEALGERAVDDVDAMHDAVTLGDAAAARAIKADGVHLVEIGERVVLLGEIADRGDRRDMAVHGIDALEHDDLRRLERDFFQHLLEMLDVVMAEDVLHAAAVADAFDHRGVVLLVGEDHRAGDQPDQGRKRGVVGDIGRGEEEGGFLAVEVGKLGLELDVIMGGAGDVAGAAGARADGVDRLVHGARTTGCWLMPR